MRRPAMDPETATQVMSGRNMMQGMARGRVPSAYPVPRLRVPRVYGGKKGAPTPPPPPATLPTGGGGSLYGALTGWGPSTAIPGWFGSTLYPSTESGLLVSLCAVRGGSGFAVRQSIAGVWSDPGWTIAQQGVVGDLAWALIVGWKDSGSYINIQSQGNDLGWVRYWKYTGAPTAVGSFHHTATTAAAAANIGILAGDAGWARKMKAVVGTNPGPTADYLGAPGGWTGISVTGGSGRVNDVVHGVHPTGNDDTAAGTVGGAVSMDLLSVAYGFAI